MKEDSQLVCPVSYEDPASIWAKLEKDIQKRLPLRNVTWKNNVSSSYVVIDKLPLRFLLSTARYVYSSYFIFIFITAEAITYSTYLTYLLLTYIPI